MKQKNKWAAQMNYNSEWGNGKIRNGRVFYQQYHSGKRVGGIGAVLEGERLFGYNLKIVSYSAADGKINECFWSEAKSVSLYNSVARDIQGCIKCPIPAYYWIHEDDPLYINFPRGKMSQDPVRSLSDFISLFDIDPEKLKEFGVNPDEYWLIPSELLKDIYENYTLAKEAGKYLPSKLHTDIFGKRKNCNMLLTYPISKCDRILTEIRFHSDEDKAAEIKKMVCHILSAILDLYRNGLAHGDIKPDNIMRTYGIKLIPRPGMSWYSLTDMGSVSAGDLPSDTCSEPFFNKYYYKKWQNDKKTYKEFLGGSKLKPYKKYNEEELNNLLRRTIMDGYALGLSMWAMACGERLIRLPLNEFVITDLNDSMITEIYNILTDIENLTVSKMEEIVNSLKGEFAPDEQSQKCISTYGRESEIRFDTQNFDEIGDENQKLRIEYGYLYEQLNFSGKHNPMLKISGHNVKSYDEIYFMQPVIKTCSNSRKTLNYIYYAPDDISGARAVDFNKYKPCSLDYLLAENKLTDELADELIEFGRTIDSINGQRNIHGLTVLPYPLDIVRIDGKWKLQPFFLSDKNYRCDTSYAEYFKMLCSKENNISAEAWAFLIAFDHEVGILYELIPDDMACKVVEYLSTVNDIDIDKIEIGKFSEHRNISMMKHLYRDLRKTRKFGRYFSTEEDWLFGESGDMALT